VHGLRRQAIALRALLGGEAVETSQMGAALERDAHAVVNASIGLEAIA
jgi:hypothetical protein